MRRPLLVAIAALVACTRTSPTGSTGNYVAPLASGSSVPSASSVSDSSPIPAPAASSASPPEEPPKGTAQLVVQTVRTVCFLGPGEPARYGLIGDDLFVELTEEGASKPTKEFAFCPPGDKKKPLQIWQNCSSFTSCKTENDVAVCGKERVWIDVKGGKTVLHGSFGEREIAPHPMKILPLKKTRRDANVDC